MRKPHRQTVIAWILFVVFLFVAAGLAAALAIVFAPVKLDIGKDSFTLSFLFHTESAAYADLEEVALLDSSTYSSDRIRSYGGISKDFGTYKNDTYGEHFRLTFWENKHNFILLKRKDGSVTVFNQKTIEATSELYHKMKDAYDAYLAKATIE